MTYGGVEMMVGKWWGWGGMASDFLGVIILFVKRWLHVAQFLSCVTVTDQTYALVQRNFPNWSSHSLAEMKADYHIFIFFQDSELTKEEIIAKHDVFVGSQATDFGEALTRHDEF